MNDVQTQAKPSAGASFIAQSQTVYAKSGGQVRAAPDSKAALVDKMQTNTRSDHLRAALPPPVSAPPT